MSVPATCRNCGRIYKAQMFHINNGQSITLQNCAERCPYCGGIADILSGTYDFAGEIITSFKADNVSAKDILTIKNIVENFQKGEIETKYASNKINEITPSFSKTWSKLNNNSNGINLILSVLTLIITIYNSNDQRLKSNQIKESGDKQQEVIEQLLEDSKIQSDILQKIHDEIKNNNEINELQLKLNNQVTQLRPPPPRQKKNAPRAETHNQ